MTTAIPVGELQAKLKPGAYVLTAEAVNASSDDWGPKATQWFIVTDLGLTTLSGNDGLHVMVRSLGTAGPVGERRAAARRGQQRGARRGDDRCRRLRQFRARPDPRHRRAWRRGC